MEHRHFCEKTRPSGGWQDVPPECRPFRDALSPQRRRLLMTRALLVIKVVVPPAINFDTFQWLRAPPTNVDGSGWTWYVDGSMLDEPRRFARRTGFAVVVVGIDGTLIAFGRGRPPEWINTAAGAEAWAFLFVLTFTDMTLDY